MLDGHIIDRIESHVLERSYPRPVPRNSTGRYHGQHGRVPIRVVSTDQGALGWGMSGGPDEGVEPFIGARVPDLFSAERGTTVRARALDLPLHDLAGKILGQPVWRMLGAVGGPDVTVYSGAIYFDDLEPPDAPCGLPALLQACAQDAEAGHAHFKLKIGRGRKVMDTAAGDRRDVEVTRFVREHYPDAKLLVDANDGYTAVRMCRFVAETADCKLYWIEEPFTEYEADLALLREACARLSPRTLLADGESRNGRTQDPPGHYGGWQREHLDELLGMARARLLDVLLMDVCGMGFSAWRRIMPELKAVGVRGSPHAWGEPLKTLYAAQLAAGLGNIDIVEGVPGTTKGVDDSLYKLVDGTLTLPDAPGFGLDICL